MKTLLVNNYGYKSSSSGEAGLSSEMMILEERGKIPGQLQVLSLQDYNSYISIKNAVCIVTACSTSTRP